MKFCVPSLSAVCNSLWAQRLQPARLLCPRDSPGGNAAAGCHFLLQGIFPPGNWTWISYICCTGSSLPLVPGKSKEKRDLPNVSEKLLYVSLSPCLFRIFFFFFQWRVVVYKNDFTRVALSSFSIFLFLWQFLFISVLKDTEDRSAFKVRHQSFELRKNTLNWIMVFTLRLKQVNFHFYSYCSHLPLLPAQSQIKINTLYGICN